jgi:hypothetical protein
MQPSHPTRAARRDRARHRRGRLAAVLLAALACGCGASTPQTGPAAPAAPPWFEDVTEQYGLDFVHDAGQTGAYFLPQVVGSGAAFFRDRQGRLNLYLLQNAGPSSGKTNRLYRQGPDGRFQDVTAGSGLGVAGYGMGVAVGDVNNDGNPDLLVTEYGRLRLFRNNGDGTFTDIAREAGLEDSQWGTSAAFVDYDRDGWLDLVVVHYLAYDPSWPCLGADGSRDFCHPGAFPGTVTRLYHNLGASGRTPGVRFEDVTARSGLAGKPGPGLGVVCADFDGDGWPDIFVANDSKPNHLWINRHDGTFKEEAVARGLAYNGQAQPQANMGIAVGDVDGDGLFDVLITHLTDETHTLWRQGPRGLFRDRTAAAGLAATRWRGTGFGTALADFDHDGALDLVVANGRVYAGPPAAGSPLGPFWGRYGERNQLFAGDGAGRFRDNSPDSPALCATPAVSRGLALADIDGDGALDLLVTTVGGRARLYRNVAPKRGHWLVVRAVDPALHRDAYGAEVRVQAGGRRFLGWVNPAQSYLCSHDPCAHFGLGAAARVDGIEVVWPDGACEHFGAQDADRVVELRKGTGVPATAPPANGPRGPHGDTGTH